MYTALKQLNGVLIVVFYEKLLKYHILYPTEEEQPSNLKYTKIHQSSYFFNSFYTLKLSC